MGGQTSQQDYAGIYLERHQARFITATAETEFNVSSLRNRIPPHRLTAEGQILLDDTCDASSVLSDLCTTIVEHTPNLRGIGVACYGPYLSLDPEEKVDTNGRAVYGVLDKKAADPPFAGADLFNEIKTVLSENGIPDARISIQTDAMAGALAEANFRQLKPNEVLLYITLTDGVGGGFVRGLQPWGSAYHSEMGLTPVHLTASDRQLYRDHPQRYGPSIGDLVTTKELLRRAQAIGLAPQTRQELIAIPDKEIWAAPANYVAQLCVACIGIVAPHCIVIGGPLAANPGFINEIRGDVKRLMSTRPGMRWPEQRDVYRFVQSSLIPKDSSADSNLAGALYLGMLTAA
ncbi:ROK family protein [Roseobacter sp. S98]|uniref:ROK family protein n=1 Tax=Roseobacter algicola (ex Choi et al. 2025) (nom. illeg.) TaxID=3092138 RepID=UPI0035C6E620